MINKLKSMELDYIRCFSEEKKHENYIEFYDNRFRNTYTSNISILNKALKNNELIELINKEVSLYIKKGKDFLNFEVNDILDKNFSKSFLIKPKRVDTFNYLSIESKKYEEMPELEDIIIKKVCSKEEYKKLIDISVKDNEGVLGRGYSIKRIKRKIQVYKDESNNLSSYICYYKNEPIGSYELLFKDGICKIEDFGVLKEYRRRGIGTYILKNILRENHKNGVNTNYLIAEKDGEAEKLYKRLGFVKYGEKTQFIW